MNMNAKLSVSSVILAAVLSGCSQQQAVGDSHVSSSSSPQAYGGSQVSDSSQTSSQQQVEKSTPVVTPQTKPVKRTPIRVYRNVPVKHVFKQKPKPTHSIRRNGLNLPAAKPGQCFAKIKINASYKTQSRRILISKATSKRVLVRAPQYRFVNNKVQVRKAYYKTRIVPAQYRTITKRVLVRPAYNTWKKGHGAITRIDNMTGEIMCRVKVPAVYKNVSQKVLVRPAQKIKTLVPAVYKTVKQKKLIAPALYKTIKTPARYKTQNYRVKTGGARYAWRAVLCKTNAPKAYKKAAVKRKAVVRTTSYKKQYNKSSGISYQDYMRVMNAGSSKTKLNKSKKVSKKTTSTKKAINKTPKVTATKSKMAVKTETQTTKVDKVIPKMSTTKNSSTTSTLKTTVKEIATATLKTTVNSATTTTQKTTIKPATTVVTGTVIKPAVSTTPKTIIKPAVTVTTAPTSTDKPAKSATKKAVILGIQKALKKKGFNPGALDGQMGAGTAAALKAFQSSRGLPVGQLNKDTFRALGLIR